MTRPPARTVVIGIGNTIRGDDAVGRKVAAWLSGQISCGAEVVESDGEPATLIAHLEGADVSYLVDACRSGAVPGTLHRLDVSTEPLPQHLTTLSTHGVSVAEAIELARALDQLPRRCVVYGIEAETFGIGSPMTAAVAAAVPEAGRRILSEIADGAVQHGTAGACSRGDARFALDHTDQASTRQGAGDL